MARNVERKKTVLATLSAVMTLLEKYPILATGDYYSGTRDLSLTGTAFLSDIMSILGITDDFLYAWLKKLLLWEDSSGTEQGILVVIEAAIKTVLITYLNSLYTCQIDPVIPDEFLITPYNPDHIDPTQPRLNSGITIPISEIDAFGLLENCPVDRAGVGSVFYFDSKEFDASNVYLSSDFNAFLWYVINRGPRSGNKK